MRRRLEEIAGKHFDLAVVGAGIHGICVARDAALRGLSVVLLDRGDFGGETSHNSLKLVHGGLRYIQHFDFRRMRQSSLECRAWLKIAPHLVRPLEFSMDTYGHTTRGPEALWVASRIHEFVGYGRNAGLLGERQLPKAKISSLHQSDAASPGLEEPRHNGVAKWYDGQMQDADRIMIECVASAVSAGATAANYVAARGLLGSMHKVNGVVAEDKLTGDRFDVLAKVTVNAAGPWASDLRIVNEMRRETVLQRQPQNINMNIVVKRSFAKHAFGLKSTRRSDSRVDKGGRLFFVVPWRGVSIIGTTHNPYNGNVDEGRIADEKICDYVDEINAAYPSARVSLDDVAYCHWGVTPGEEGLNGGEARRARHGHIIDHRKTDNLKGLISVVGVKWTTARLVAENVTDVVIKNVSGTYGECRTSTDSLPGAEGFRSSAIVESEIRSRVPANTSAIDVVDLATDYGTRWREIVDDACDDFFRCKAKYAVKNEMAVRLVDVLCRRTNLLQRGRLSGHQVSWCLDMMGRELDWSESRKDSEMAIFEQQRVKAHASILS